MRLASEPRRARPFVVPPCGGSTVQPPEEEVNDSRVKMQARSVLCAVELGGGQNEMHARVVLLRIRTPKPTKPGC